MRISDIENQVKKQKLIIHTYEPFTLFRGKSVNLGEAHIIIQSKRIGGYSRKRKIKEFIKWCNYNKPCGVLFIYHYSNLRGR